MTTWQIACCYEEQISQHFKYRKILTLVPDSCSRKYCSEYFGVSGYLIRSARELKQKKGILAQPSQKKGKAMAQETIDLVCTFSMRMMNKADSFPGERTI